MSKEPEWKTLVKTKKCKKGELAELLDDHKTERKAKESEIEEIEKRLEELATGQTNLFEKSKEEVTSLPTEESSEKKEESEKQTETNEDGLPF